MAIILNDTAHAGSNGATVVKSKYHDLTVARRDPDISVVIMASKERAEDYLPRAINSTLDQTLDRRLYAVTVVANFTPDLRQFRGEGVELVVLKSMPEEYRLATGIDDVSQMPVGCKIAAGVENAKGAVVATLDDDDRFLPDKLQVVHDAFASIPNLGLFINNFSMVINDGASQGRVNTVNEILRKIALLEGTMVVPSYISRNMVEQLSAMHFGFNSSRMSFRPGIIDPQKMKYVGYNADDFIFSSAVSADRLSIVMDQHVLSEYTLHSVSITHPATIEDYRRSILNWIGSRGRSVSVFGGVEQLAEHHAKELASLHKKMANIEQSFMQIHRVHTETDTSVAQVD